MTEWSVPPVMAVGVATPLGEWLASQIPGPADSDLGYALVRANHSARKLSSSPIIPTAVARRYTGGASLESTPRPDPLSGEALTA